MANLLRLFVFRHARKRPLRVLLGALSIALGVAMFVSTHVAISSAGRAFESTAEKLAGGAKLQVIRGRQIGVDADALKTIDALGVPAAPVVQTTTTLPELKEGTFLVLGVDFAREQKFRRYEFSGPEIKNLADAARLLFGDGCLTTRRFAERHGLKIGSTLAMNSVKGRVSIAILGLLEDAGPAEVFGGNILVMSIGRAQALFGRAGKFDRIEILDAGAEAKLRAALGPGYDVVPSSRSSPVLDDALRMMKALLFASAVALLVGLFIIYNTVSISIVERIREIGILRSLGATRGQVLSALLLEWGLLGFAASAVGAVGGWALARLTMGVMVSAVNTMISVVEVREIVFDPKVAAIATLIGTLTALLGALRPSLEGVRASPIETLRAGTYGYGLRRRYVAHFAAGVAVMIASFVLVSRFYLDMPPFVGLVPALALFAGAILVIPQLMIWTSGLMRGVLRRLFRIEGYLAADNIIKFPQRTALTVGALGGALGMMISTAAVVEAFNRSGQRWMEEGFPFDVSVSATNVAGGSLYSDAAFPGEILDEVCAQDVVELAYGVRSVLQEFRAHDVMIVSAQAEEYRQMQRLRGSTGQFSGLDDDAVFAKLTSGEGVLVSENFAHFHGVGPGDRIELKTMSGPRAFEVVRVVEDYSWPTGVIVMELATYREHWKDETLSYVDVRFKPGVARADGRAALSKVLSTRFDLFLFDIDELKAVGEKALRQSMQIAQSQVVIAMVIGFLGIVNTLLISVLRRTREIGLLRAVGMTRGQVARTVVVEGVFMAATAGLMGVAVGMTGAAYPVRYNTLQMTGFLLPVVWPWREIAVALAVAVAIGFVASLMPARRAARLNVLEAISYE